jgi:pantoate--beta-alanine ligase
MRLIEKIDDMKTIIRMKKKEGISVGLVPTMGYLHEGHMSLVRASKRDNDFTVMSIFVNPKQFGAGEDFRRYPRDMQRDAKIAEDAGVDVIFAPCADEMYPHDFKTGIKISGVTDILCGKTRVGHFDGVATVVAKLFNIISPDRSYFGQKDAQQAAVIKSMVKDLNMDVDIVTCPIVREPDGLAMSSRNVYLSADERRAAVILSKALYEAEELIKNGERKKETVRDYIMRRIMSEKTAGVEYVEILDADSFKAVDILTGKIMVALAVRFGKTRLIDNIITEVDA